MKLSEFNFEESDEKHVENEIKNLQNMSQDELMKQFLNEVNKQKRDGTFDVDGLEKTIENMKNYLPQQSYENIMRIISSIK